MNKEDIRQLMLHKRLLISNEQLNRYSHKAVEAIKTHPLYIQSHTIGIYHPIKNELDITKLISDHKAFSLPRVEGSEMHYYAYHTETELQKSNLHILEPIQGVNTDLELDLIIIPALAVDSQHHRLGYGKGFFDRFISKYPHIKTLCVVLDFQRLPHIPNEPHDQMIHDIIFIETEASYDN